MGLGQSNNSILVHQMLPRIKTLGPFSRFALWTQGCMKRCPGCVSPDSRPLDGGREVPVEDIAQRIHKEQEHEGITISGGEPFLQAAALCRLIDLIRQEKDYGVILYTGYVYEELKGADAPADAEELLKRIDLMIDGPYIRELNDNGSLRGSSNQRLIWLTDRYKEYANLYGAPESRNIEIRWTGEEFFIAGIPSKQTVRLQWPGRDD